MGQNDHITHLGSVLVGVPKPLAVPQASEAGSLLKVSGSVVGFKQPTKAWKHTGGTKKIPGMGWDLMALAIILEFMRLEYPMKRVRLVTLPTLSRAPSRPICHRAQEQIPTHLARSLLNGDLYIYKKKDVLE